MSDSPIPDTRERIYLATLSLIEEEGAEHVTTRAIAAAAGVNLASINYYYRSKDILLSEVIKASWEHTTGDLRAFLSKEPWDPNACLGELADYLLEGGHRYPRIARAHFLGINKGKGKDARSDWGTGPGLRAFIEEMAARVSSALGEACDEAFILRTASFVASLIYPALLPEAFPSLSVPGRLARYRDLLVENYIGGRERAVPGALPPA